MENQFRCKQFHAIPGNSAQFREYFTVYNFSAIPRNEMAQAEATVAQRNSD